MYDYLEQVHLVTQRQGAPFLQIAQKTRQVLVDLGGTGGLQRPEDVSDYSAHPSGPGTP
jgi:hypothetical protein